MEQTFSCAEMSLCVFCDAPTSKYCEKKQLKNFLQQIEIPDQSLLMAKEVSFCGECYSALEKAVGWREQVGEVERDVRSLQRIILKMMRQLTSLQGNYLEEMRKLESKIKASQTRKAANSKGRKKRNEETQKLSPRLDAVRNGVLNVVTDLEIYQNDVAARHLSPDNQVVPPNIPQNPKLNESPQPDPALDIDIEYVIKTEPPAGENNESHNYILPDNIPAPSASNPVRTSENTEMSITLRSHPCKYCGRRFKGLQVLQQHIRIHTGERPYQCKVCLKKFRQQSALFNHKKVHSGEKPFQCFHCSRSFGRRSNLKRHLTKHKSSATRVSSV